jgi:hypothetical protein
MTGTKRTSPQIIRDASAIMNFKPQQLQTIDGIEGCWVPLTFVRPGKAGGGIGAPGAGGPVGWCVAPYRPHGIGRPLPGTRLSSVLSLPEFRQLQQPDRYGGRTGRASAAR